MNTPEQQLSESLLAVCKAAGIEEPKFIAQDKSGHVYHYNVKPTLISFEWLGVIAIRLNHQPYADDWQDSLLEWVDHIADTSKKVDDACKIEYHAHLEKGDGLCWSRAGDYRQGWQDALAWKEGNDD